MKTKIEFIFFLVIINLITQQDSISNWICGYLFGYYGIFYVLLVNSIVYIIVYYFTKLIFKNKINYILKKTKYNKILKSKKTNNFLIILSRLPYNYPDNIISMVWASSNVKLFNYIFYSIIGSIPSIFIDLYIGNSFKNIKSILTNKSTSFILIITFTITILLTIIIDKYIDKIILKME